MSKLQARREQRRVRKRKQRELMAMRWQQPTDEQKIAIVAYLGAVYLKTMRDIQSVTLTPPYPVEAYRESFAQRR